MFTSLSFPRYSVTDCFLLLLASWLCEPKATLPPLHTLWDIFSQQQEKDSSVTSPKALQRRYLTWAFGASPDPNASAWTVGLHAASNDGGLSVVGSRPSS